VRETGNRAESARDAGPGTGHLMPTPPAPESTDWLIADLVEGTAIRRRLDEGHVRTLVAVLEHCPPILVTADGAIVDGRHRVEAARRAGWVRIPATVLPDTNPGAAVLAAMAANAAHGLPLTRSERRNGVRAVLDARPDLSDRAVAQACGVARTVVADVRAEVSRSGGRDDHLNTRAGADGKQYPVDGPRGRAVVEALVRVEPGLTTRRLSELANVSVGSAHGHRRRVLAQLDTEGWIVRWIRRFKARRLLRAARRQGLLTG